MIEGREQARHIDSINSLDVDGARPHAYGRLVHVASLINTRMQALDADDQGPNAGLLQPLWRVGPAFEVHIRSGLHEIMADVTCRLTLRHIVAFGESARVVVQLHEPLDEVTEALSHSGFLSAELIAGRALRHVAQGGKR